MERISRRTRRSGKPKPFKRRPSPKPPKPSLKYRPKRVSQVDEHDSEHVEHEEHDDQDDAKSSEGDPQVDFATSAINYSTKDTRHTVSDSYETRLTLRLPVEESRRKLIKPFSRFFSKVAHKANGG